ncbi:BTB/POZ fold protein [Cordyceps fumosorosea ARSEF 2679]|uniref:BTB/POZ fold protein n=1 Tax=Cordyceps fumosorosea (strain ARSEF 2679) TaxID=1081104 RepID=A0A167DRZ8_CORFA|nr:BTB/POZ fold protein [Cordyceps fumosorosea ARSEF 2679]OAA42782.1 BTB/POZ fold protein [Cordyceps fumosorosea ARSEF 2679]
MAQIPYNTILVTKPFRFLVGPKKLEFYIHTSLLASQSPTLDTLVYGQMKEAINGCTVWEDVSEDTFIRFGQYVYTGDYDGAAPFEPPASPTPPATKGPVEGSDASPAVEALPAEENISDDDFWRSIKAKKAKKKKAVSEWDWGVSPPQRAEHAWEHFTTTRTYLCAPPTPSPTLKNLNNKTKEYAEVFLSHARVHVMADYYLIQPLATLALHKLHEILCNFTLHKTRISDIVALLQFCYEADERPVLRELVVFFGQNLWNKPVRVHLCHNAAALKKAGVTHFAIEFNKMPSSPDYKRLCDELSAHGIMIILADVDQRRTPDEEQREAYMTKRIVDILEAEPNAKVAALFSSFHTGRYIMDGIRPAAVRIESAGYSLIRLMYCGGSDQIPTLITHACRDKTSLALDMRPYGADAPFGGDADFMLYLG